MAGLTQDQLKLISYLSVGVATEGGRTPYRMTIALSNGQPISNSRYSLGVMQFDFGAHVYSTFQLPNGQTIRYADALVNEVNAWAAAQGVSLSAGALAALRQDPKQQQYFTPMPAADLALIQQWGDTDAGKTWVHTNLDAALVAKNAFEVAKIMALPSVQALPQAEQEELAAMLAKNYNQSGGLQGSTTFLSNLPAGQPVLSSYRTYVGGFADNYLSQGILKAGEAGRLYATLATTGDFKDMLARAESKSLDPASTAADPELMLLKSFFSNPKSATAYLQAGGVANSTSGFVFNTTDGDLVVLNASGSGYRRIGAQWVPVINGDEKGQGILIRKGSNGKWNVAFADGTELPLAEEGESINIGGKDVQLAQAPGSVDTEFWAGGQGQLLRIDYRGSSYSVAILGGPWAGQTATVAVSDGSSLDAAAIQRAVFGPPSDAYAAVPAETSNATITVTLDDGQGNVFTRTNAPAISDDGLTIGRSVIDTYVSPGTQPTRVFSAFGSDGGRAATFDGAISGRPIHITFDYEDNGTARVIDVAYLDAAGNPVAPQNKAELVASLNERSLTPDTLVYVQRTLRQAQAGDPYAGIDQSAPGYGQVDPDTGSAYGLAVARDIGGILAAQDPLNPTGGQTLLNAIGQYGGTLVDALSLIKAIQTGDPLPILASGLRLANDIFPSTNLSGAANIAGGVLSLLSLDAALERGDTLGALTAGAQAVAFGAQAYATLTTGLMGKEALVKAFGADSALASLGDVLPYLSLINSIANGDPVGAAVSVLTLMEVPYIGWAYAVYSIIDSLFGDEPDIPDPWGSGRYVWDGSGISYQSAGETGGNEAVANVMGSVLSTLNALIERERQQNPGAALGIIPNRMPGVGYDMSGYRYTDIDPLTGAEQHPGLRFDTAGRPYNAEAGSPESWQSLGEGMVRSALARGAIAPLWEVETARLQTNAGDPKAGLTEEERAGRDGQLAAPIAGATQTFRPVALDLDGDGIETTTKADGVGSALPAVAFDVDDSGYLKATGWVKGDDAFLVLDRDVNGQFDSGRELFSNGTVALGRRGLAGMAWVDSNYDGRLTAADPVWNELRVWRDLDQDGAQDTGEVQGLDALGVSELNYAMGSFTQAGQQKQLASPDLDADKDGTRVSVVPEGILVQASANGRLSLLVTRIDDRTAVEANRDGVSGYEDVELIVSGADLLANDTLGGFLGRDLTITGLTNFRHGTGFVDANGFVRFTPEANYASEKSCCRFSRYASNDERLTWVA